MREFKVNDRVRVDTTRGEKYSGTVEALREVIPGEVYVTRKSLAQAWENAEEVSCPVEFGHLAKALGFSFNFKGGLKMAITNLKEPNAVAGATKCTLCGDSLRVSRAYVERNCPLNVAFEKVPCPKCLNEKTENSK